MFEQVFEQRTVYSLRRSGSATFWLQAVLGQAPEQPSGGVATQEEAVEPEQQMMS